MWVLRVTENKMTFIPNPVRVRRINPIAIMLLKLLEDGFIDERQYEAFSENVMKKAKFLALIASRMFQLNVRQHLVTISSRFVS